MGATPSRRLQQQQQQQQWQTQQWDAPPYYTLHPHIAQSGYAYSPDGRSDHGATLEGDQEPIQPCYKDPVTGNAHVYRVGDNVILLGKAQRQAAKRGLANVATVIGTGRDGVCLRLYTEAIPERQGRVGAPHPEQVVVPLSTFHGREDREGGGKGKDAIMRPLPIYVRDVPPSEIEQRLSAFGRWTDALATSMNDPDPDMRLKTACGGACAVAAGTPNRTIETDDGYHLRVRDVLALITAATPEGTTRRTTLVCDVEPATDPSASGHHALDPSRCARPVIVATVGLPGGTMRYGIVPLEPKRVVQSAALCAYGLPLTPAYYGAIEWDKWDDYDSLVKDVAQRTAKAFGGSAEVPVDSVWLYHLIKDLVKRGYRVTSVDLGCDAPATGPCL